MQNPIDVNKLPSATTYLNYPNTGPAVGAYLGPNDLGEYLTVVTSEPIQWSTVMDVAPPHLPHRRVGLRHGIYTVNGELTGELAPEVWEAIAQQQIAAKAAAEAREAEAWRPVRTPPILGLVGPSADRTTKHKAGPERPFVVKGID